MTRLRAAQQDQDHSAPAEEEISYAPFDQDSDDYGGNYEGSEDDPEEWGDPEEAEVGNDQSHREWLEKQERKKGKKGKKKG